MQHIHISYQAELTFSEQLSAARQNLDELLKRNSKVTTESLQELERLVRKQWDSTNKIELIAILEEFHRTIKHAIQFNTPSSIRFVVNRLGGCFQSQVALYKKWQELDKALTHHLPPLKKHLSAQSTSTTTQKDQEEQNEQGKKQFAHLQKMALPTARESTAPLATYAMRKKSLINHYSNTTRDEEGRSGAFPDMMNSIRNAKKIIFIMGWIIEPQYRYSNHHDKSSMTLGELLVKKAIENPELEIAVLCWYQVGGKSNIYSTLKYLKEIAKSSYGLSQLPANLQFRYVKQRGVFWSRHIKLMVVDENGTLVGYYGSADLAAERINCDSNPIKDSEKNKNVITRIFRASNIYRYMGFYFGANTPRRLYREIHSQVKGEIVRDLLIEAVTSWNVTDQGAFTQAIGSRDPDQRIWKCFQRIDKSESFALPLTLNNEQKDQPLWHAQLVRSGKSSSYSSWFLADDHENSIHEAMLRAIDCAEKSIYIETQFLIAGPGNRIVQALIDKVAKCDKAGNPFHIIFALPSSPESEPLEPYKREFYQWLMATFLNHIKINPVRYLQTQTIRYLTSEIAKRTGKKWETYLSLFMFGKSDGHHATYQQRLHDKNVTQAELNALGCKQIVYIHSKFMSVDGGKIIINGSANLNCRSLDGKKDNELAVVQWVGEGHENACLLQAQQFLSEIGENYFGKDCMKKLGKDGFLSPELPKHVAIMQERANTNFQNFIAGKPTSAETGLVMTWPFDKKCFFPGTPPKYAKKNFGIFKWHPEKNESPPVALRIMNAICHSAYS